MKQIMKTIGLLLLLCVVTFSCKNGKTNPSTGETAAAFEKEDTTEVMKLVTDYLKHLENKEFDLALQMLSHVQNDSVVALTAQERADLMNQYETFPVLSYKVDEIVLTDENHTEVGYTIEFFKLQPGQEDMPNTIKFRLDQHKIDGKWCLSVLNR